MRALVMTAPGGAENSVLAEIDEPVPGPGEVTIDVAHAGLNFVDVMARRGDAGYASWPHRPGLEVSGTVRALGPDVHDLTVGDRVVAVPKGAGMSEIALAAAELTVPVPDGVGLAEAAATPLGLATSLLLLTEAGRFNPGDTVLVHSASGGIGTAIARLVPLLGGGRLIGTVGRPEKIAEAERAGYQLVLARDSDPTEAIRSATGGRGVDLVLDPLGTTALGLDLDLAAPGGRVVLFGNATGAPIDALPPVERLLRGNLTISGFSHRGLVADAPTRVAAAVSRILGFLADGRLTLPVTEVPGLADIPAAHDLLAEGRGTGKYVARIGAAG
ncbi:quinone oxidoreductase family protein [Saccharothrix sp. ST-888]|uniref:quinone oxidoreductase family protein n=1 Tax=Saccharothrix sp. ST-888 TaxID=1427391 RepID=UPI0005ED1DF6|nr:zinc-binding dehydrogenase [Saccharothrix sp. ST-888]KJK59253.1 oxidoreductase [Saccharothrix sp. ST-888]